MRGNLLSSILVCVLLFCLLDCVSVAQEAAKPQDSSILRFREGAAPAGLDFQHVSGTPEKKFILESMSGGVALFDYDNDGFLDVYLVNGNTLEGLKQGKRTAENGLYRNRGDGTFENVTRQAGVAGGNWDMGAVAADIDNDGNRDLFVTGYRSNHLYRNCGDGTFEDITQSAGVTDNLWSTGAAFGDFDNDRLLDLAVIHYAQFDIDKPPARTALCRFRGIEVQCGPRGLPGAEDTLFRNLGHGKFKDITQEAHFSTGNRYYGLGVVWVDYDNDDDLDLLVANDSCPNFLFRNDGGRFSEVAMETGIALNEDGNEQAGMGVAIGDVDNDGWLDIVQTNFSDDKDTLYRNEKGQFVDASYEWKIGEISWQYLGWGAILFDADLDGYLDLFISNGHVYPEVDRYQIGTRYRQRGFLFHNQAGARFKEVGREAGMVEVFNSRGAAVGDLNNDGRPDIVVNRLDGKPALYWNETPLSDNHWIGFDLRGTRSNRDAIGARVTVVIGDSRQTAEVAAGASYLSQNDRRLIFGLGNTQPSGIDIRWPDGQKQRLKTWKLDDFNFITEPNRREAQMSKQG